MKKSWSNFTHLIPVRSSSCFHRVVDVVFGRMLWTYEGVDAHFWKYNKARCACRMQNVKYILGSCPNTVTVKIFVD